MGRFPRIWRHLAMFYWMGEEIDAGYVAQGTMRAYLKCTAGNVFACEYTLGSSRGRGFLFFCLPSKNTCF